VGGICNGDHEASPLFDWGDPVFLAQQMGAQARFQAFWPGISPGLTAQVAGFVMIFGLLRTLRLNYRVKVTPGVTGLKVC
jgi:hypothetical protein